MVSEQAKRQTRWHGRVEGVGRACDQPGCTAEGEFRAPADEDRRGGFDGPPRWRWFCLDHVREFNARYNFFSGMTTEEIEAQQRPYAGWERETRAFSTAPGGVPRWADFTDPLDAIQARFRDTMPKQRQDGKPLSDGDRRALKVLELEPDADRRALRQRYADLVQRYHPDRNGGDRSHEQALQKVIEAYTLLKSAPAFA